MTFGVEVGGQIQPLPIAVPQTPATDSFSGTAPYTCDGDVMVSTFEAITVTFDRIG